MKISFHIDSNQCHLHVHRGRSKNKSHCKTYESALTPRSHNMSQLSQNDRTSLAYISPSKQSTGRSTKLRCPHKKAKEETRVQNEYYQGYGYQERNDLLRENQKLRRENKVLNDYFEYFDNQQNVKRGEKPGLKEPIYSFKRVESNKRIIFADSDSKATPLLDTRFSSRFHTDYNHSD